MGDLLKLGLHCSDNYCVLLPIRDDNVPSVRLAKSIILK